MIKKYQRQTGSAHVVTIVILVAAVLGLLGFVFWQNFINKDVGTQNSKNVSRSAEDDLASASQTHQYTFDDAVTGVNETLLANGCSGSGIGSAIAKDAFKQVEDSAPYIYQGGMSKINTGMSHAFVQYGCGSQGSVALLTKADDTWILVSENAREYPICDVVRGHGFPASIVNKCYVDDRSTDPVAL